MEICAIYIHIYFGSYVVRFYGDVYCLVNDDNGWCVENIAASSDKNVKVT